MFSCQVKQEMVYVFHNTKIFFFPIFHIRHQHSKPGRYSFFADFSCCSGKSVPISFSSPWSAHLPHATSLNEEMCVILLNHSERKWKYNLHSGIESAFRVFSVCFHVCLGFLLFEANLHKLTWYCIHKLPLRHIYQALFSGVFLPLSGLAKFPFNINKNRSALICWNGPAE